MKQRNVLEWGILAVYYEDIFSSISSITDRVLPELEAWRNRSLDEFYPIVWLDALHYKVMDEKNYLAGKYGAIPDLNSTIEDSLKEE